jgi:two-component system OmpR family response regulator
MAQKEDDRPGQSILVVDDDPQVLKLFSRLLRKTGHSVTAVSSGSEALTALQQVAVDLLVLDLSMPSPDGFEILKQVRSSRPGLRILVVSGYLGGALLDAAHIMGATAVLGKQDAAEQLVPAVKRLLRRTSSESG